MKASNPTDDDSLPIDSFQLNTEDVDDEIIRDSTGKVDSGDADNDVYERWKKEEGKAFHYVKMGCIYGVPIIAGITVLVYFLNLLLPPCARWLEPKDLSDIQSLVISIVSGVSTSLAVNYFYNSNK